MDYGFTDQTKLNLCKQCKECIFWDMGKSWCAPDKGICRIYCEDNGYMTKPDDIMNDKTPCPHRQTVKPAPIKIK